MDIVVDYKNDNSAFFDGFFLCKEEFGQSYQYDSNGNVVSTIDLTSQGKSFEYDPSSNLTKVTSPAGNIRTFSYSGKNLIQSITSEGVRNTFSYDTAGNVTEQKNGSDSLYIKSTQTYSPDANYLKTQTDPSGNTVTYSYNTQKGTLDSFADSKNKTTSYTYDNMDRLTGASKTADGQAVSNSYGYTNDRLSTITHNNFNYNFNNDSLGNNTQVSVGTQPLITNSYESRTSRLLRTTYGNGQYIDFGYDSLDRISEKKINGVTKYKYSYDSFSNLGLIEDIISGTSFRYYYDMANRLSRIKDSLGNETNIEYDIENNVQKLSEKIGNLNYSTSYEYDKDNRPKKTIANNGSSKTYNYDSLGRMSTSVVSNGATNYVTAYYFHPGANGSQSNRLSAIINNGNQIDYTYDVNGNIDALAEKGKVIKYYYNELNEVVREDNQVLGKTITYEYDAGGNILNKREYAYTTGTLSGVTKTIPYAYDSSWKDKMTSYDGKAIAYDQIGNPTGYDGKSFTWENGRQLSSITGNGQDVSYKYNDQGIRTEKVVNGVTTNYHLVGDKVSNEETQGFNTFKYEYSQNQPWTHHGFNIQLNTQKSYVYSMDVFISSDTDVPNNGVTFVANSEIYNSGGTYVGGNEFIYDNTKKGQWQHLEKIITSTSPDVYFRLYPTAAPINENQYPNHYRNPTKGYILYSNVKVQEAGSTTNLFPQVNNNSEFQFKGNGIFDVNPYNYYKYEYYQDLPWTHHGYNIQLNTQKSYIYSMDVFISSDTDVPNTGTTFVANSEIYNSGGIYVGGNEFIYDNTKKGQWQHLEKIITSTSPDVYFRLYPTAAPINENQYPNHYRNPTKGHIVYSNVQVREVGTNTNLFPQANNNSEFPYKGNGYFQCSKGGSYKTYYTYDANENLVSGNFNGSEYYYLRNGQNDVIGLIDSNGAQVVSYTYDTWGKLVSIDGPLASTVGVQNPYRYRGYRYDTETGMYYCNSRYYNPEWGRWLNADSVAGFTGELLSHNMFAYCLNNPVNAYDPDGDCAWWVIGGVIGVVAGGVVGAVISYKKNGKVDWRYVAGGAVAGALVGAGAGALAQAAYTGMVGAAAASGTGVALGTQFGKLGNLVSNPKIVVDWASTTAHGLQRMTERGVTQKMVETWMKSGQVLQQAGDKFLYITKEGAVVVNKAGNVITAYGSQYFDSNMQEVVKKLFGQ